MNVTPKEETGEQAPLDLGACPEDLEGNCILSIEGTAVTVNKPYLSLLSPVFHRMFYGDSMERASDRYEVCDVDKEAFIEMLRVIMPSRKPIDEHNVNSLLAMANRFEMEGLRKDCISFKKKEKMFQNACRAAREAELRVERAETLLDSKQGIVKEAKRKEVETEEMMEKKEEEHRKRLMEKEIALQMKTINEGQLEFKKEMLEKDFKESRETAGEEKRRMEEEIAALKQKMQVDGVEIVNLREGRARDRARINELEQENSAVLKEAEAARARYATLEAAHEQLKEKIAQLIGVRQVDPPKDGEGPVHPPMEVDDPPGEAAAQEAGRGVAIAAVRVDVAGGGHPKEAGKGEAAAVRVEDPPGEAAAQEAGRGVAIAAVRSDVPEGGEQDQQANEPRGEPPMGGEAIDGPVQPTAPRESTIVPQDTMDVQTPPPKEKVAPAREDGGSRGRADAAPSIASAAARTRAGARRLPEKDPSPLAAPPPRKSKRIADTSGIGLLEEGLAEAIVSNPVGLKSLPKSLAEVDESMYEVPLAPVKELAKESFPGIKVWSERAYLDAGFRLLAGQGGEEHCCGREVVRVVGRVDDYMHPYTLVLLAMRNGETSIRVIDAVVAIDDKLATRLFPQAYAAFEARVEEQSAAAAVEHAAGPSAPSRRRRR